MNRNSIQSDSSLVSSNDTKKQDPHSLGRSKTNTIENQVHESTNSLTKPGQKNISGSNYGPPISTENGVDILELDSEDDYISSGDDVLDSLENSENQHRHLTYGSGLAEHTAFFEKSLGEALDLVALDSSLALQAQLSGQLNDKAKLLLEKQAQILNRVQTLKGLYKQYISDNKLGELEKDIDLLDTRISRLKHGHSKQTLFRKKTSLGVVDRFPIEYNQARDKVVERMAGQDFN